MEIPTNIVKRATPWLDYPLVLSGAYREYECTLNDTALCDYQMGYWRFWYEADHRYALPTVAFFLATVIVFALIQVCGHLFGQSQLSAPLVKARGLYRYASTRRFRVAALDWNSAPVGILLLGAIGTIFFMAMTLGPQPYYWPNTEEVDFGSSPPIATRAGWMALACMPFVFATAGKANLITMCTAVSHERLQVFHRWISYAFFVLSLIHTFPFIIYNFQANMMTDMWNMTVFYWTGVVALVAQAWLTFASWGPLRSWCYEWFKFSHFVAALIFVLFLFFHCDATLTAWDYFVATGVLFAISWLYRQARIYFEHGIRHHAHLTLAPNGFIRVSIPTRATWTVGQHYFVRFMTLGLHAGTTHPFTACSLPSRHGEVTQSELVFFIRPRGGTTLRLAHLTKSRPNTKVRVLLDGPYGGVSSDSVEHSQRSLVVAGGSGAGWIFPFVTAFFARLERAENHTDSSRRPSLRIVLAARDVLTTVWFEEELNQLLASHATVREADVEVEVYYTGPNENKEKPVETAQFLLNSDKAEMEAQPAHRSGDKTGSDLKQPKSEIGILTDGPRVQHREMRPTLAAIVAEEATSSRAAESLAIFVCGPLSMENDISNAVAQEQLRVLKRGTGNISLHLEHFSWA